MRDLRRLDAGDSLRGWLLGALLLRPHPRRGPLAAGLLSFHEIEAAVMLQPPSISGGGSPLADAPAAHFARTQDLARP